MHASSMRNELVGKMGRDQWTFLPARYLMHPSILPSISGRPAFPGGTSEWTDPARGLRWLSFNERRGGGPELGTRAGGLSTLNALVQTLPVLCFPFWGRAYRRWGYARIHMGWITVVLLSRAFAGRRWIGWPCLHGAYSTAPASASLARLSSAYWAGRGVFDTAGLSLSQEASTPLAGC